MMFDLGARSDATTDAIRPAGEHVTPDRLIAGLAEVCCGLCRATQMQTAETVG